MLTPWQFYQQELLHGRLRPDPEQARVMQTIENIFTQLVYPAKKKFSFNSLRNSFKKTIPVKGLYIWGNVGVGKTHLINIFYECIPFKKRRFHFHDFMKRTQDELNLLSGKKNPLKLIAEKLAAEATVICFDEFYVSHVADAMILSGLINALLEQGICLMATSNLAPDELYKEGLQRERFLPTIQLIQDHCHLIKMTTRQDYRCSFIDTAGVYLTPHNADTENKMLQYFNFFSESATSTPEPLILFERPLKVKQRSEQVIWCDFNDICGFPRSADDYLLLAKNFHTVLISQIPIFLPKDHNLIAAFIHLVDIFYDAHIRLIVSAQAPLDSLYMEGKYRFAFLRTQSRLIEMQSKDYLTTQ